MPCTDGIKAMDSKAKQEVAKTSHQQEHPKTDACSPLCSCSCCSGTPIPQALSKLTIFKPELTQQYSSFYSSSIKGISLPIWQPPQLV
jgi:hypothetical protein